MKVNDFILISSKDTTENEILEFTKQHNLNLPPDYKNLVLTKNNGGCSADFLYQIHVKLCPIGHDSYYSHFDIGTFFSLEDLKYPTNLCLPGGDEDDVEMEQKYSKYLLIADGMQCCYLLGIQEENFDQVYIWVLGEGEENNPNKVSDSFLEFIELIELEG